MISSKKIAQLAGIGYLIIFVTGIFANFFVVEKLIIPGNATATAENIIANDALFRTGILSFMIMVIMDVLLAWALFIILIPVNRMMSLLSAWLRLVNGTIFAVALYHLINVMHILNSETYLRSFEIPVRYGLSLLSLNTFNLAWLVGLIFFGLHLLVLGYLIMRSGYIPGFIGILLLIAGAGYLVDSFANFLLPSYADYKELFSMIVIIPGVVGELSLTFWLLIKSKNVPDLEEN